MKLKHSNKFRKRDEDEKRVKRNEKKKEKNVKVWYALYVLAQEYSTYHDVFSMRRIDSILSQFISMKATTTKRTHAHVFVLCWHFQFNSHTPQLLLLVKPCNSVPIHCFTFYSVIMVVREWHLFPAFFCVYT